jgi:hypothetical protein
METKVDLTRGGIVVVLHAQTGFVKEFATNPQVKFIDCKATLGPQLEGLVIGDVKVAVITDGLPQYHYTWITSYCNRRKIPYLVRKSNQAVYDQLKSFFPTNGSRPSGEEVSEEIKRGKLKPLIAEVDWSRSNADEARRLQRMATEKGIKTTFAALAQAIAVERRKRGQSGVPRSIRSKLDLTVEMFDKFIEEAQAMREFVVALAEENRILKAKVQKIEEVFK